MIFLGHLFSHGSSWLLIPLPFCAYDQNGVNHVLDMGWHRPFPSNFGKLVPCPVWEILYCKIPEFGKNIWYLLKPHSCSFGKVV
jgi:hypothetical protein